MRARCNPIENSARRRFAWRRKFLVGAAAGRSVPDSRGGSGRYLCARRGGVSGAVAPRE